MRSRTCGECAGGECGGCCAVCRRRFVGVFCRSRLVSLMLLRAALLSAAENRVTDREKEESCGL